MKRVLIVDDEENIGRSLKLILEREGYAVSACITAAEAKAYSQRPDVYLIDVRLPDGSGIDLVRWLRANDVAAPALMISGHGTIAEAVEATRAGAFDFLEKPLSREKVLLSLKHALENSKLREENQRLQEIAGAARMIGQSPAFQKVLEQATLAARTDARMLLTGESGTGKELLAAHIHAESPFAAGPFVKVNCAAIPTELIESELFGHEKGAFTGATSARRGKFELADGGTLFLDECGDLHASSQAKLLRVLAGRRISSRGRRAAHPRFGARDRRHQSRPDRNGGAAEVPGRSLLPSVRSARARAGAARAAWRIFSPWPNTFWRSSARAITFVPRRSSRRRSRRWSNTPGPAISASCATWWSGWRFWRAATCSKRASVPVEIRWRAKPTAARGNLRETRESAEREHILRALAGFGMERLRRGARSGHGAHQSAQTHPRLGNRKR